MKGRRDADGPVLHEVSRSGVPGDALDPPGDEPLATINYGWDDLAHYTKWIHGDEAVAREMEPQERKHLVSRMKVCLETAVWAGRAAEPMFRLAARTWVVLSERLQPFHEVPYVRALARRGLKHVSINVAMGFRNQREVNETRLD